MIALRPITPENEADVLRLQVTDDQRHFVADNRRSLDEASACIRAGGHAFPFGIYDDDQPVGFLMVGYGVDDDWPNPPEIAHGSYNVWRLMIDENHQHRGCGRQALQLALDFVRTWPCGKADICWLSYEPENHVARELYRSMGFAETGDMDEGEVIAARGM